MSAISASVPDRGVVKEARRIVVKVGSSLLTRPETGIERKKIADYCAQVSELMKAGYEIILVSSGAIAEGCMRLGWRERPTQVPLLQAAAAVGQIGLLHAYEQNLTSHTCGSAMVMLTHDDLADRQRYLNARATLSTLMSEGVVPIINENDTVATDEIRFGDNDTLAALVANLVQADLLIILTDVEGLLDADPKYEKNAQRIAIAAANDSRLDAMAGTSGGEFGRGGMTTKVRGSRLAARSGAHTIIASGHASQCLVRLCAGQDFGTLLYAEVSQMTARKRWIADQLRVSGELQIDSGAAKALKGQGVSLLAAGVIAVSGEFRRGDLVRCVDALGEVVAQGLSNYASYEVDKLRGLSSEQYAQALQHVAEPEIVHRDNLVIMSELG